MAHLRQICCKSGHGIIRYFPGKELSQACRVLFFTQVLCKKMNKAKLGLNPEHNNTRVTWSACRDLKALRAQCHRVPPPFMQAASLLLPP
ncbi:hypothetical protein, partial [Pseudomonas sp. NBRC 111127]|uniref:hypothetical protein n=1 Tax=Pseudomonas sp. NBRC 111127 TaxID=1661042 RepID=UPI001C43B6D5